MKRLGIPGLSDDKADTAQRARLRRKGRVSLVFFTAAALGLLASCATEGSQSMDHSESVRYWSQGVEAAGMKAMTVSDEQLANQELPVREDPKLVILMYHNLVYGRTGGEYNRDIYNFEHDLVFIRKHFEIIDFNQLLAIQRGELELKHDAAIITFDDGDLSMYGIAYPLLRQYDIKASFFIISGSVGEVGYMNWAQIREMAAYRNKDGESLFTMGSHGVNHLAMGEVDEKTLIAEFSDSKQIIEEQIGIPVEIFALPYGSGAGRPDIEKMALETSYKALRSSDRSAPLVSALKNYRLPGIYIDNASTDKAMAAVWKIAGR
ncbi:MAG: polysaccharide deacetylase family protein [Spirochaetales bacterium]|nr:polysaccharide deacetylase family protein [Spirochaetales bacterium]